MKLASWPIILLLVFALLIQNTCPHGFAGKSTLARKCGHCPSKQVTVASPHGQKVISADHHNPANFPMYVLAMPTTAPSTEPVRFRSVWSHRVDDYKDALPDGFWKPPRA
jgi:hypothetical protein